MHNYPKLATLEEALALRSAQVKTFHHKHLNPRLSSLLESIEADRNFTRAEGEYLWDENGTRYLDCVTGCGALSLGHNHPRLLQAFDTIRERPQMVETLDPLQGALAHNLCKIAPGKMQRVYFVNSGAEAIDTAIKLARTATRRPKLVACRNGFHGRTIGALSVTQRPEYRVPFGQLLEPVDFVPFGDADALESSLRDRSAACFVVEPIQAEGGIVVPPPGYLAEAAHLCRRYGTLLVADEVQTGLGRTGALFAVDHEKVAPDVLVLGKALGGGVVPLSAVLTTDAVFRMAGGGTVRTPFHHTTYGGYPRACAVGLAVLEVLLRDDLPARARSLGDRAMANLRRVKDAQPLIADVRGRGLLIGVELAPATGGFLTAITGGVVNSLSQTYFSGLIMMHMLKQHQIISAFTVHNPNVLRLEPPLNVSEDGVDCFVTSLESTLQVLKGFIPSVLRSPGTSLKALFA